MSSKFRMLEVHASCVCHRKVVVTLPNTVESTCRSNFLQIVTFAYDVAWNVSMFLLQRFVCAGASSSSRLSNTCTNRSGGKTHFTAHLCLSICGTVSTAQTAPTFAPIGMSSLSSFCVPGVAWPFSPRSPNAVCLCDSATPFRSFCDYRSTFNHVFFNSLSLQAPVCRM